MTAELLLGDDGRGTTNLVHCVDPLCRIALRATVWFEVKCPAIYQGASKSTGEVRCSEAGNSWNKRKLKHGHQCARTYLGG